MLFNPSHPYNDLLKDYRFYIYYGGRGSAKSWTIAELLIRIAQCAKVRVLCTRELQTNIGDSVHKLLGDTIQRLGMTSYFEITQNSIRSKTGSEFIFKGVKHNYQEIKSMEGIDLVWVEECQSMSEEAWQVIMPTIIRKPGSKGIISFNTGAETDPTYRRWVVNPPKLSVVHQINYDQNEFFTEELESIRVYDEQNLDKDLYDNIWNGLPLKLSDDVIFRNRVTIKEFEAPINADYLHGIDFGFSSDPFAFTRCFVDHETNELYIDYAIGGYGIEIDEYGPHLDQVSTSRRWKIYADCSLPGNISLLKRQGYNVEGCKKWAGSVEDGISHLKSYKQIIVHPRCKELIKEFSNYKWKRDRVTGEIQPIPIDKDNHYIDSLRYGLNKYIINAKTSLQQWSKLGK